MDAIPGLKDIVGEDTEFDESGKKDNPSSSTKHPLVIRTPESDLPYFNPLNSIIIAPEHSHCIGLALIRGIDISRRRLQVITPISPGVIEEINSQEKRIVLVNGKFDTPGWAYTEDIVLKTTLEKGERKPVSVDDESDEDIEDSEVGETSPMCFDDVPWVERLEGSQGRGVGSKVWRVRRDLGRSDGGE